MWESIRKHPWVKRIQKTMLYSRWRQYLPMAEDSCIDDRGKFADAEVVRIDWPAGLRKPRIGIVRDFEPYPRWTKYIRFCENNAFPYGIYDLHSSRWLEEVENYDVIVGLVSNDFPYLAEMREKYHFLETYLGKKCFPSAAHTLLFENKRLEAYISTCLEIPYAKTFISHSRTDALAQVDRLAYPLVSKVDPASGSAGVEIVHSPAQARRIIQQSFSRPGRKIHVHYYRQKNYVYFQDFIPNDGYDIRVILVGNWAFGYYRKVLDGDFRASGMNLVEKRALPLEAIRTAWRANQRIRSPQLVVDMVHGLDDRYTIIEFSPTCQMETPEQLHVDGVPGYYEIQSEAEIHFIPARYWLHELALREFLQKAYLTS